MLWGHMLWVMRRPWMKRLQRASQRLFPEHKRAKAIQSMNRQNRWARRFGLKLLTFSVNMFLASVIVTATYFVVLDLYQGGYLEPPKK